MILTLRCLVGWVAVANESSVKLDDIVMVISWTIICYREALA